MTVTLETTLGPVRGEQLENHQRFRGIPFATPPVGDLRFAAPQPPQPWTEVLDALDYSDSAHQAKTLLPGMAVAEKSEDCLYLNVFTPAADDKRRPVLFWIHGGGFRNGGASQGLYEGAPIVTRGDVVLVTINYRLGALGYLDLPELDGATANAGQLDQIAALEWTRDNIERFGGDPDNVTIFGESAGGMAVSTLLGMPAAKGLFHKAIAQSGAASACLTAKSAAKVTDVFLDALGLTRETASEVRKRTPEELIAAQNTAEQKLAGSGIFLITAPVIDGTTLPENPLESVRKGDASEIPFLSGTCLDEWRLFEMPSLMKNMQDRENAVGRLGRMLSKDADSERLVDVYAAARGDDLSNEAGVKSTYLAIQTDRTFRIPAIRLAEAQASHQSSTYMYLFCSPSPARRGELGACHAIEIPFVFGTLDAPGMEAFAGSGPEAEKLSEKTMDAWLAFARTGDPNHPGLPAWETYGPERRSTMRLDLDSTLEDAPMEAERVAFEELG